MTTHDPSSPTPLKPHRFVLADLPGQSWRNGGGTTREILRQPAEATGDTFSWRVSLATIASAGPFSLFPDTDRIIMALNGAGIDLSGPDCHHRLGTPYSTCTFEGGQPHHAQLLDGTSTVLNIISDRRLGRARLDLVTDTRTVSAVNAVIINLYGVCDVDTERLAPDAGLWWAGSRQCHRIHPTGPGAAVAIIRWEVACA